MLPSGEMLCHKHGKICSQPTEQKFQDNNLPNRNRIIDWDACLPAALCERFLASQLIFLASWQRVAHSSVLSAIPFAPAIAITFASHKVTFNVVHLPICIPTFLTYLPIPYGLVLAHLAIETRSRKLSSWDQSILPKCPVFLSTPAVAKLRTLNSLDGTCTHLHATCQLH